jgi:putative ABC transport system ATP-binding protein
MAKLDATELYRFYHTGDEEVVALRGVDIQLSAGEIVALVGPSGSGKTTLLACLAGLDEPDGGTVDVMGERMSRRPERTRARIRAQHIGMFMQSGNLIDHLTVGANIRLQRQLAKKIYTSQASDLFAKLGLATRWNAMPSELSGGEAARAGLAVALAAEPEILICDEPTGEVDAGTETLILADLAERRDAGTAILVATHSAALARLADRVVHIRDGRIVDG